MTFCFAALAAFLAVALLAPAVSFVKLRRVRDEVGQAADARPLAAVFLTELLVWLAFVVVFAFILVTLLALGVFVTGHAAAASDARVEPGVSVTLVVLAAGCVGGLALVGRQVHNFTARKLRPERPVDPERPLSLSGGGGG
jgi:hypothetical protein